MTKDFANESNYSEEEFTENGRGARRAPSAHPHRPAAPTPRSKPPHHPRHHYDDRLFFYIFLFFFFFLSIIVSTFIPCAQGAVFPKRETNRGQTDETHARRGRTTTIQGPKEFGPQTVGFSKTVQRQAGEMGRGHLRLRSFDHVPEPGRLRRRITVQRGRTHKGITVLTA